MKSDGDQNISFYGFIRPVLGKTFSIVGICTTVFAIIQFFYNQNVPVQLRSWGITVGIVVIIVAGLFYSLYRLFSQQKIEEQRLRTKLQSSPFLLPYSSQETLPTNIHEAEEIFIFGLTLENLLHKNSATINQIADESQANIKILLPDVEYLAMAIDSIGIEWGQPYRFQQEVSSSLDWLSHLVGKSKANIEIKLTKTLPTISLLVINPRSELGHARVSMHLYHSSYETRPCFEIWKRFHPEWFKFFVKNYYEDLWRKGADWETGINGYISRAKRSALNQEPPR